MLSRQHRARRGCCSLDHVLALDAEGPKARPLKATSAWSDISKYFFGGYCTFRSPAEQSGATFRRAVALSLILSYQISSRFSTSRRMHTIQPLLLLLIFQVCSSHIHSDCALYLIRASQYRRMRYYCLKTWRNTVRTRGRKLTRQPPLSNSRQ